MELDILLTDNSICPWVKNSHMCIRGWFFECENYYCGDRLLHFYEIYKRVGFVEAIKSVRGNFSVIIIEDEYVFASGDRIASFPLFYIVDSNGLLLSDSLSLIWGKKPRLPFLSNQSFDATGFALDNLTLFKDVYRIQCGDYIKYDKISNNILYNNWFMHFHQGKERNDDEKMMLERFDSVIKSVFTRLIRSVSGKPIVVLLSGGYDSRLVIVNLKELGYENVICLSGGDENDLDTIIAERVAKQVGYPWKMIKTDKQFWEKQRKSGKMRKYLNLSKRTMDFTPFILGAFVHEALEKGIICPDSVIVTGQSGDAIEGEDVSHRFESGEQYKMEDVVDAILERHFILRGKDAWNDEHIRDEIRRIVSTYSTETIFDEAMAEDIVECFNCRERQSKYVVAEVRGYDDLCRLEWRLPLWDEEFVDFWLSIPYELRKNRKLYYRYVGEENLPTANIVSMTQKMKRLFKKSFPQLAILGCFFKGLYDYYVSDDLFFAPLGGITQSEYYEVFKRTKGFRNDPRMYFLHLMKKKLL